MLSFTTTCRVGAAATGLVILSGCQPASVTSASVPNPTSTWSTADREQLSTLEARALRIPLPNGSGICPDGPQTRATPYGAQSAADFAATGGNVYGTGPVYLYPGDGPAGQNNQFFDVTVFTDPTVRSVVLLRGEQLGGPWKVVATGPWAAGAVVGEDVIGAQRQTLYSEVAVPADLPRTKPSLAAGWSYWEPRIGIDKKASSCFGFQIDTVSSSEVFVVA